MMRKSFLQNLLVYCVAGALVWYVARGVAIADFVRSFGEANLWLFIPVSLCGFLIWFVGETLLFARLFTYFHKPTTFREMIPPNAAQYFLQLVNLAVAGGALAFFLHRRKGVPWLAAGCTLLFQGLLDIALLAAMTLIGAALVPSSPIRMGVPYAAGSILVLSAIAATFLWWRPTRGIGRWIYERKSLVSFRLAQPRHYLRLALIRTPIFALQGFIIYGELRSFHVEVPLSQAFALTPAVLFLGGLPVTPVGLGSLQAVVVAGFSAFGSRSALLASSLAVSAINLAIRIPLGLGTAGAFANEVREGASQPVSDIEPVPALARD
ncbi:MAG: lysylphosphatidylglycerol synthase transmembrane domain-containing protein, partial [Candidatus Binataceae bacterium]